MNNTDMIAALNIHLNKPKRAVFIKGPPGCGKTSMPRALAKTLGIPFYYFNAPITDALEVGGVPYVTEAKQMAYALPENLMKTGPGILLVDELSKGSKMTQNAFSEILQERTIRGQPISDEILVVATGNRASDKAGEVEIPTHIRDRVTFYDLHVDPEDWLMNYAVPHGIHELVRGLIHWKGLSLLSNLDVRAESSPSPRGWEAVSDGIEDRLSNTNQLHAFVSGTVGEGAATEFLGFQRFHHRMPDLNTIYADPHGAQVPSASEIGILYALITALSSHVTMQTANNVFAYLMRLTPEMAVLCAREIGMRDVQFLNCEWGTKFFLKHGKFIG